MNRAATAARSRADEITDEATLLFLKNGFAGTSMSGVAAAVGIQKASLYHHFDSKEALFIACVSTGFRDSIEQMQQICDDRTLDDLTRLRQWFDVAYRSVVESPIGQMSPIIAETSRHLPSVARRFWEEYICQVQAIVCQIIKKGAANGIFRELEPRALEMAIFAPIVHTSLSRQMFGRFQDLAERYDVEATKAMHIEQVLYLLRRPEPSLSTTVPHLQG